jgi:SMC interacting uncharacterized protein involved in chromosome segregation
MKNICIVLLLIALANTNILAQQRPESSAKDARDATVKLEALVVEMKRLQKELDRMIKQLDEAMRELKDNKRLGNSEIQELMSDFNQAAASASRILRKIDESRKSVTAKP